MCREGLLQLWESWVPRGRTVQNPAVADQVFATEYTQKTCRLKLAAIPPAKLWKVVTTGSRHEKKTAPIEDTASPLDEDRITKALDLYH